MRKLVVSICVLLFAPLAFAAEGGEGGADKPLDWRHWQAGNEIDNLASLQRGARNFMGYCVGCHSLRFMRYSRMAADLKISDAQLEQFLLQPGAKKNDYIITTLAPTDGDAWFGKAPPDLSLMTRARGVDKVYQFLKTFYSDPGAPTGVNNLVLPGTAMPHVLSDLQGVNEAVFGEAAPGAGEGAGKPVLALKPIVPGKVSAEQYDEFVRDTVNFLSYVAEPVQSQRVSLGIWVILFLLTFTAIAHALYKEYWKDVK